VDGEGCCACTEGEGRERGADFVVVSGGRGEEVGESVREGLVVVGVRLGGGLLLLVVVVAVVLLLSVEVEEEVGGRGKEVKEGRDEGGL